MKIILWGINYAPESIGIAPFNTDLCDYLAERGHDVSAVVTFPYYPRWSKSPGDRGRWHRAERIGSVAVHRCWCYVPAVTSSVRRIIHEFTFGLTSAWRILLLPRAEVYLVVSPPLILGFFAWVTTVLKRSRFIFHVQDLQPDAAMGLGMLRRGWLAKALYRLERLAYTKAAVVSGISSSMITAFREKGVPAAKCMLLPNWLHAAPLARPSAEARNAARASFGITEPAVLAVYSGNLGRKQHLEILIEAAAQLPAAPAGAPTVRLIIAGDGAARADLEESLRRHSGAKVELLPVLSDSRYAALLGAADVALITQAAGTGKYFLPSKLLSVLAAGLPVVAVADEDSELSRAVVAGGFGCTVPPGDVSGLAKVLNDLAATALPLASWAARTGWVGQFSRDIVLPRFEQILQSVAEGTAQLATKESQIA